ncbi:hypothetical protein [Luteococcus sp. OSA5]|uniref:hypothetical protein n=1 Tax=Luteococcus sp. OSA5 TaxID=3401630 RepID=UPI003B432075
MPIRFGHRLVLFVFSVSTLLAGLPWGLLPWVAREPIFEPGPFLSITLGWALGWVCLAALLVPVLSSPGARLATVRYTVTDTATFSLLWLAMGLLVACVEGDLSAVHIAIYLAGCVACCAAYWWAHDGCCRWRRRTALERHRARDRWEVVPGQVTEAAGLPRLPHDIVQVTYQPSGRQPMTVRTVGQVGFVRQVLVTYDRHSPGRVHDVVVGTLS